MRAVLTYGLCLLCLLACDFVWLSLTGDRLYRPAMGDLMREGFLLAPALGFYLIYGLGLALLVVAPAANGLWSRGGLTWRAALYGLAAFATYDLTGLSVIRNWPVSLSFIDMGWGVANSVVSANLALLALRLLKQTKGNF
ncbi:MAG: DUF2177 family protein [Asticcacaulis sp.]